LSLTVLAVTALTGRANAEMPAGAATAGGVVALPGGGAGGFAGALGQLAIGHSDDGTIWSGLITPDGLPASYQSEISIPSDLTATPGATVSIPIYLKGQSPFAGAQAFIGFQSSVLSFVSIAKGSLIASDADWIVEANVVNGNQLRLIAYPGMTSKTVSPDPTKPLAVVQMQVSASATPGSTMDLTFARITKAVARNGDTLPLRWLNGKVKIGTPRPDLLIKKDSEADTAFAINDVYQTSPSGDQIETQTTDANKAAAFHVKVQNDGDAAQTYFLKATESDGAGWTITYKLLPSQEDITDKMRAGYTTPTINIGESVVIVVQMTPATTVAGGNSKSVTIAAVGNAADTQVKDAVMATATVGVYSISGIVTLNDTTDASGVKVEAGGKSVTTLADGKYTIGGLVSGTYPVKASKAEYTFTDQNVTLGPDKTEVNFTGTRKTYSISGTVTLNDTADASGVKVEAGGKSATTLADGKYTITGLIPGTYTVKATKAEYTFAPATMNVTVGPVGQTGANFTGTRNTYSISGAVTLNDTADASGVKVEAGGKSVTTIADGKYTIGGLVSGTYQVKASKAEYTFTDQNVTLEPDITGVNFAGMRVTPDLLIKKTAETDTAYQINNVYQTSPSGDQTEKDEAPPKASASFSVKVENDATVARAFVLKTEASSEAGWTVVYKSGTTDIMTQMVSASGYTTGSLAPGGSQVVTVDMTPDSSVIGSTSKSVTIKAFLDSSDTRVRDAVMMTTTAKVVAQPDALIKESGAPDAEYQINDTYQPTPTGGQILQRKVQRNKTVAFSVKVENDGNTDRGFVLKLQVTTETGWTVVYKSGTTDVTSSITQSGGYPTKTLSPREAETITVEMTPSARLSNGSTKSVTVNAFLDSSDSAVRDSVKAIGEVTGASPPTIASITPNEGANNQAVDITNLSGGGFQPGAAVKLKKEGQSDINATEVKVILSTKITCKFDLQGKATGLWNVAVVNPDEQDGYLLNGFTVNPPPPPTVQFTLASQSSPVESGDLTITAQLSAVSAQNVTVPYSISGTATENVDYTITASPITIPAGRTTGTITITIKEDTVDETDETVIVTMGDPTNATKGATTVHTATIADDDGSPSPTHDVALTAFSASPTTVSRGQRVTFSYTVKNNETVTETNLTFRLTYNGQPVGQPKPIASLGTGQQTSGTIRIKVPRRQKTGDYLITGAVSTVPGETNTANNSQTVKVTVK